MRVLAVARDHVFGDLIDVFILTGNGDSSYSREIDKRQIRTGTGINGENDWLVDYIFASSCYFISKFIDFQLNLLKIRELLPWNLLKNTIGLL